jgi:hypothetical protein
LGHWDTFQNVPTLNGSHLRYTFWDDRPNSVSLTLMVDPDLAPLPKLPATPNPWHIDQSMRERQPFPLQGERARVRADFFLISLVGWDNNTAQNPSHSKAKIRNNTVEKVDAKHAQKNSDLPLIGSRRCCGTSHPLHFVAL